LALVKNVDIIAPVTDDPYEFGEIAVANSLSDIYAKGGTPIAALNILCIPRDLSAEMARRILEGALHKLSESKVALLGGHTVEALEPKFGQSVVGTIDPDCIVRNSTSQPGDMLILTKPIGVGIIITANKMGRLPSETLLADAVSNMTQLNKQAMDAMLEVGVNSCTDISGFGLLGHLCGMVRASNVGVRLYFDAIPRLAGIEALAAQKIYSPAVKRNRDFFEGQLDSVVFDSSFLNRPEEMVILFDPQTSGGLLISVARDKVESLMDALQHRELHRASVIGEVVTDHKGRIEVLHLKP
jgi:selenide,water dikinase